jgi:hypothetical protein
MRALHGFAFKQLTELPLLKILGGQLLPRVEHRVLKEQLDHKVLQAHRDRREHKEPRAQLLVQQTKLSIRMAQTTLLVVLALHMTEQILLLVGKSVLPHQRVMKVENFS